jgi:hypothetical protein
MATYVSALAAMLRARMSYCGRVQTLPHYIDIRSLIQNIAQVVVISQVRKMLAIDPVFDPHIRVKYNNCVTAKIILFYFFSFLWHAPMSNQTSENHPQWLEQRDLIRECAFKVFDDIDFY